MSSVATFLIWWSLNYFSQLGIHSGSLPIAEGSGNHAYLASDSLIIQHFQLSANPLLLSEVKKYIKEQEDSCQLFRDGYGYVAISGVKLGRKGEPIPVESLSDHLKDIEVVFDLGLSSFYPHQGLGMPLYYSFVDNRLVLIFDQQSQWLHKNKYSGASESKIKELIHNTLLHEFKTDFVFTGLDRTLFKLSAEQRKAMSKEQVLELGSFTLLTAKTVTQHFDGSISYRYPWIGKMP